ncbi:MAG: efflux RND transporter periplasmic adaptor subunit [Cyclobacteriaceae bacterium]
MNIKNKILISVGLGLLMASCGSENGSQIIEDSPVEVSVKEMGMITNELRYQYSGKVISDDQTILSTKLLGQISKVFVQEGEKVTKGQLLVQIKSGDIESKLASAKAAKKEAVAAQMNIQKNFDRLKNLFDKGSATQKEFDDIGTALTVANAKIESVEQQILELEELLTYANLRSPINGFISQKYLNTGDLASPGNPILALESMNELKMDISVPEFEIQMFSEGNPVSIRINALNKTYQGLVDRVIHSTAFSGAQFKVAILIEDADEAIKPGLFGKVTMRKEVSDKLVVDEKAIHRRGQLQGVFVVSEQNEALLRWLRLGANVGGGYEVLSGLDEGDRVVISSATKLRDGQKVEISKSL